MARYGRPGVSVKICQCGGRRRPGEVVTSLAMVDCVRCADFIEPPVEDRVAFLQSGGLVVETHEDDTAFIRVSTESGEDVATGHSGTLQQAITALKWIDPDMKPQGARAHDKLRDAAFFTPGDDNTPDDLQHNPLGDVAQSVVAVLERLKGRRIKIDYPDPAEREKTEEMIAFLRDAAAVMASGIMESPELSARAQGAPFCPHCQSIMKPWPVRVPDERSGQKGNAPAHLLKLKTAHAWRCKCSL